MIFRKRNEEPIEIILRNEIIPSKESASERLMGHLQNSAIKEHMAVKLHTNLTKDHLDK